MFMSLMFHHLDNVDSTKLAMFGLIQIWEYTLNQFTMKPIYRKNWHLSLVQFKGNISQTCFLLIPIRKWFPIDIKVCVTLKCNIPKHLPLEVLVRHVLMSVNPCGRSAVMAMLAQIAKLPKKSQRNHFKICKPIWDDLSGGLIEFFLKKKTLILFFNWSPSRPLLTFLIKSPT